MPRVRCALGDPMVLPLLGLRPCQAGPLLPASHSMQTGAWSRDCSPARGYSVAPLIVELWPCRHSSLCLTEWQRAPAGAAASWAEAAWRGGQSRGLAGLQQSSGNSWGCSGWRGTRLFEGLVEDTCPVLELENGLGWGPSVWRDTRDMPCLGSCDKASLPGCRHLC